MQVAKVKNVRGHGRKKKVGMFNRFEEPCREYIRRRARQLDVTEVQFIQNCVGLAGPDMPPKFKYIFNNANGK